MRGTQEKQHRVIQALEDRTNEIFYRKCLDNVPDLDKLDAKYFLDYACEVSKLSPQTIGRMMKATGWYILLDLFLPSLDIATVSYRTFENEDELSSHILARLQFLPEDVAKKVYRQLQLCGVYCEYEKSGITNITKRMFLYFQACRRKLV
jgi:hypothetical protein